MTNKVLRGGAWSYYYARYARIAYRYSNSPNSRFNNIGFRLVEDKT
jgi:formylglycine-generating enzyme required for sulfatase activity